MPRTGRNSLNGKNVEYISTGRVNVSLDTNKEHANFTSLIRGGWCVRGRRGRGR